jgi:hypothetical protein
MEKDEAALKVQLFQSQTECADWRLKFNVTD